MAMAMQKEINRGTRLKLSGEAVKLALPSVAVTAGSIGTSEF
jgi:hypothetical protein